MPTLKQTLSYLILGQKGGKNRIQIIDLLNERPYNLNQLADELKVNYRTVKHHIDVLVKNELVGSSKTGGYGEVYFLTPEMESNMALFKNLVSRLSNATSQPGFFQNILEQSKVSVIIMDNKSEVLFWNIASEELFGYNEEEIVGSKIPLFVNESEREDLINKALESEHIPSVESKMNHKSGDSIEVSLSIDCIKDEDNNVIGFSIISKDITDLKQEMANLKENSEKYRNVLDDCCPEKLDEIEVKKIEPQGPSCPVNYGDKKKKDDSKSCCGK